MRLLHHRLPVQHPAHSQKDHKAYKCTLCSDRVSVGLEPACVKTCPTGAIVFGSKDEMKVHAAERIVDLKSRGYDKAGLYDPDGVGGTHVMYVLHHADTPRLYAGLPDQPVISPLVGLWKGFTKPLALLAMGAAVLAGFFHYVRVGPQRVRKTNTRRRPMTACTKWTPRCMSTIRSSPVGKGAAAMNDNKPILRYTANERTNHWIVAILFFMAGLSGLALFHPALFWLSHLFGGGPWTRILHPFMGVAMFVFSSGWWALLARQLHHRQRPPVVTPH